MQYSYSFWKLKPERKEHWCANLGKHTGNLPEETGNIEVGGMGSHGVPPPTCAWHGGKFNPASPCLVPGANWQYELNLLRPVVTHFLIVI